MDVEGSYLHSLVFSGTGKLLCEVWDVFGAGYLTGRFGNYVFSF
jgi:hypothetical protein